MICFFSAERNQKQARFLATGDPRFTSFSFCALIVGQNSPNESSKSNRENQETDKVPDSAQKVQSCGTQVTVPFLMPSQDYDIRPNFRNKVGESVHRSISIRKPRAQEST